MSTGRRRPRPATLDWEARWGLTQPYVHFYDQDREFRRAIMELYEARCATQEPFLARAYDVWDVHQATWADWQPPLPSAEWARAYLAAVAGTAKRFGLQRLGKPPRVSGDKPQPSYGERLIHGWCSRRARARQAGRDWPPERFSWGVQAGGARPELGDVIVDGRPHPLVPVQIEVEWDPRSETKAEAKKRLLSEAGRRIDAELERIAVAAEGSGYRFPDRDNAGRDLTWLFWKVRHKLSYGRIVKRSRRGHPEWLRKGRKAIKGVPAAESPDNELVKRAVVRMADAVGIDRTGWKAKTSGDT
jgi:hypothetical protein